MGIEYPPEVLNIQPHAIPAIRREYEATISKLDPLIQQMKAGAYIRKPWLADPESVKTADFYNTNVMEATDGPFAALQKWRDELQKTHDTLTQVEATYRRTEGANSELWGRKA